MSYSAAGDPHQKTSQPSLSGAEFVNIDTEELVLKPFLNMRDSVYIPKHLQVTVFVIQSITEHLYPRMVQEFPVQI